MLTTTPPNKVTTKDIVTNVLQYLPSIDAMLCARVCKIFARATSKQNNYSCVERLQFLQKQDVDILYRQDNQSSLLQLARLREKVDVLKFIYTVYLRAYRAGHALAAKDLDCWFRNGARYVMNSAIWFHRSAVRKVADSQFHMALLHATNFSERSQRISTRLFTEAAQQGHSAAQKHLSIRALCNASAS